MPTPPQDLQHPSSTDVTDLVTAATAHGSATVLLSPPTDVKPQRIARTEMKKWLDVDDAETAITAIEAKTDHLTVTAATDLDDIRTKVTAHNVKLLSESANLQTDIGLTPNDPTSRTTIQQDPGNSVRAANKAALEAALNGWTAVPTVAKKIVTPPGSFAINGPLDTTTLKQAFNNLTWTGQRPEYQAQHIEVGGGQLEWASRIDIYNASDNDYFIDLPGGTSFSDWPGMFHVSNMVWHLGDLIAMEAGNAKVLQGNLAGAVADYASAKGGFIRIGNRDIVGSKSVAGAQRDWDPLARGIWIGGMCFSDWILAKSNQLYGYMRVQGDGSDTGNVTINRKQLALVELNRCYDPTIFYCTFRGGRGPQIWLANCDRPNVIMSRHMLAYIAIQNGVFHNDPAHVDFDRDWLVDDGVTGTFQGNYVEQPAMAGMFAMGGTWDQLRVEGGYQESYPAYNGVRIGPGYWNMPTGTTWSIAYNNLAGVSQIEEQYIQFANLPASITPFYGASSRAPVISDYVVPGMVLRLRPSTPNAFGFAQRPEQHVIVTAVDDTNARVYFFGGYRGSDGNGIGTSFVGKSTTGTVLAGTATECTRIIGIPFVGGGSRLGCGIHSITQNASPIPGVPRYAMSYDRGQVHMGPYCGGVGIHTDEAGKQDAHRPVICASGWGGSENVGAGVTHLGPTPPRHWAVTVPAGKDLIQPPRGHRDFRVPRPESFDFFSSVSDSYALGTSDWMLQPRMIEEEDGTWVPTYDCATVPWQAFRTLPADTYNWTARIWSPKQTGHKQGATITRRTAGDHIDKVQVNFADAHWFVVGQSLTLGGTGGVYNITANVVEVVDADSIVLDSPYVSDVGSPFDCFLSNNSERFILNFRVGAGDGTGTSQIYPVNIDYAQQILQGWTTLTGTSPAGTTDVYVYDNAAKLMRVAWIGLTAA